MSTPARALEAASTGTVISIAIGSRRPRSTGLSSVPALYMAGDRDLVVGFPGTDKLIANLKIFVPDLRATIMLPGCGHWTQQERAAEVNAALIEFLRNLP